MKITSKNLRTKKKALVALACKIVHERDRICQFCGRASGKLDASHCIPRSRGWQYAVDTDNIILLCAHCHLDTWHESPTEGAALLEEHCPDTAAYVSNLHYAPARWTVA